MSTGARPDEVGEEVEDAGQDVGDRLVEERHDVDHVLQALRARLVQPGVHLCSPLLCREGGGVSHLNNNLSKRSDDVPQSHTDTFSHTREESISTSVRSGCGHLQEP